MTADPNGADWAAAVMAGGRSTRMGRDKALLPHAGGTLLARQVDLLRALRPAEIMISRRPDQTRPPVEGAVTWVFDDGAAGPLGGLVPCLERLRHDHLLVLAVDLPAMDEVFLRELLAARRAGVGTVPVTERGWEPLAAIYPRAALADARAALDRGHLALQSLVRAGIAAGWLVDWTVPEAWRDRLENLNVPPAPA